MARPRNLTKIKQLGPLGEASNRLQLLERAGLSPQAQADILLEFVEQARMALTSAMNPLVPTQPDYHARLRAGGQLIQLIGANPPKSSGSGDGASQVVVNIELEGWATGRAPKQVGTARSAGAGQVAEIIEHPA